MREREHKEMSTQKKKGKEDGGQNNSDKNETKVVRKGGEGVDRVKSAVKIQ